MNQLDRLEKRIRALFETSASLLPWTNPNDRIVHELSIAIQELFINTIPVEQLMAPVFVVNLHPQTMNLWREQPDWQSSLSNLLITTATEFGTHFHSTPSVLLKADPSLALHEVAIYLKESPSRPQTETSVLSLSDRSGDDNPNPSAKCVPLLILKGDKTIQLTGSVINIGRKTSNHIVVNDLRVSRNHAQIRKVKDDYVIFDVGSSGGTFINGNRIDRHTLRSGDVISLAGYTIIYTVDRVLSEESQRNITSQIKSLNQGMDNS